MSMQNPENNFETLIKHVKSMLGRSYDELKRKYLSYPISLTVHVDKKENTFEQFIKIRFSEQCAITTLNFDQTEKCDAVYLFFDNRNDEDIFIEYLAESYDFYFKENCWLIYDCFLKVKDINDIFYFYFHK